MYNVYEFETPEPIEAVLEIAAGEVRIVAELRGDTRVRVNPSDLTSEDDVTAAGLTEVHFFDGHLRIKTDRRYAWARRVGSIEVEIELPEGSGLRAELAAGGVHAQGRLGETRVQTSHGEIQLGRTGRARLETGSGEIVVGFVDGDAQVKTPSGDVHLGEITGNLVVGTAHGEIVVDRAHASVEARTAHGGIRVGEVADGVVDLVSASGQIDVGVKRGSVAKLGLGSTYGSVRNLLEAGPPPEPAEVSVDIRASTTHGNVVVRRSVKIP